MKFIKNILCMIIFFITILLALSFSAYSEDHIHTFKELYTVRPVCTEKGYTVFSCECGESYKDKETAALGHNFSSESVCYKAPTCVERGEAGRYCIRCFAKKDVVFYDKTKHTPVTVTVKGSTEKDGEIRKECSVCKKIYSRKTISKINSVKLEKKIYTYDSKVKTPSVTVTDKKGNRLNKDKDYSLKYEKGRKKTGIYTVRVIFKGNYEGEKTLYFKIRPTKVRIEEVTPSFSSVYLSWDKSKGASGYEIYLKSDKIKLLKDTDSLAYTVRKIGGKKLKSGQDYAFVIKSYKTSGDKKIYSAQKTVKVTTRPQKTSVRKISVSNRKVKLTLSKQKCHGYEILISTNKSFSNPVSVILKGKNSNSYTFSKPVRGKTYYVKARAYVISGGEKYYGYYCNAKMFKI